MTVIVKTCLFMLLVAACTVSQKIDPGDTFSNCIRRRPRPADCDPNAEFRTIDGTCNNLRFPRRGASLVPLRRLTNASYVDGFDTPRGFPGTDPLLPPANEVSTNLFPVERSDERERENRDNLSVLFMTFGQFLDHDIALAPHPSRCDDSIRNCRNLQAAFTYPCFPILIVNGDSRCTTIARSQPVCQGRRTQPAIRQQINIITSFVDGSQVYGSDEELQGRLRTNDGTGQLKVEKRAGDLLPFDEEIKNCTVLGGCSLVGDERGDENVALHAMHTLFVREHNRIAVQLRRLNPSLKGDRIYQTARKIVGGILQKIVFEEWLPNVVRLPPYNGYNERANPNMINGFATAAFRFGHSLIPGSFTQLNNNFDEARAPISLREAFLNRQPVNNEGIERTLFGLVGNRSNTVDNRFVLAVARRVLLRPDVERRADLLAYNIHRGRDHGLGTYGEYRRICGLDEIKNFDELESSGIMIPSTINALRSLYKSPNDIDLFAAGISENVVPGFSVGPTFACLIRRQFRSLRDGDRFFYLSKGVFTDAQRNEIEKASMSRVMCDNMRGIVSIQPDAFKTSERRVSCESFDLIPRLNLRPFV